MKSFNRLIILVACVGLFYSAGVVGQDSVKVNTKSSMQTVFGRKNDKNSKIKIHHLGIYFAPEYQYGQLNGAFTSFGGTSLMLQVNKKWGIGVTGFGGGEHNQADTANTGGMFGGLKVEYTPKPDARVHVTFPLFVGMGGAGGGYGNFEGGKNGGGRNGDRFDHEFGRNNTFGDRTAYAVIQPGINLEANVVRFARVFVGANYRFAFSDAGYSSDFQGFALNAGLKIGVFDYALRKGNKNKKSRLWKNHQRD